MSRRRGRKPVASNVHEVVGYIRVSTVEQKVSGAGLEDQRRGLTRECDRREWNLVGIMEDIGSGGSTDKRPNLAEALDMLKRGEAGTLMATKVDRLSRSVVDFGDLLDVVQKGGWNLVVLDLGIDLSTAMGEAMANMAAVFAQLERRLIGERTAAGMAVKRSQGVHCGRPASVPTEVLERIRTERKQGKSWAAIARGLNEDGVPTGQGGKRWYHSTVSYLAQVEEIEEAA
jgi:DNA invertase Pin-like site-specific DNA recombinase